MKSFSYVMFIVRIIFFFINVYLSYYFCTMGIQFVNILDMKNGFRILRTRLIFWIVSAISLLGKFNFFIIRGLIDVLKHHGNKDWNQMLSKNTDILSPIFKTLSIFQVLSPFVYGLIFVAIVMFFQSSQSDKPSV